MAENLHELKNTKIFWERTPRPPKRYTSPLSPFSLKSLFVVGPSTVKSLKEALHRNNYTNPNFSIKSTYILNVNFEYYKYIANKIEEFFCIYTCIIGLKTSKIRNSGVRISIIRGLDIHIFVCIINLKSIVFRICEHEYINMPPPPFQLSILHKLIKLGDSNIKLVNTKMCILVLN